MSTEKETVTEHTWVGVLGFVGIPTTDSSRRVIVKLGADRLESGAGVFVFDEEGHVCGKVTDVEIAENGAIMAEGITVLSPGTYHVGLAMDTEGPASVRIDDATQTMMLQGNLMGCQIGPYEDGKHGCWPGVQMVVMGHL